MFLSGIPLPPLGSFQESLCQAVWIRREQFRIFETMINILASGLSLDPQLSKRIERLTDEYIDLVIPGAKEVRKRSDEAFIAKTANALADVAKLLSKHPGNKMPTKRPIKGL